MSFKDSKAISLTPAGAVSILSQFLPEKWTNIDPNDVTITRITEGYVNTVNIVQVRGKDETRVIIRHNGGNLCSEAVEKFGGVEMCPMDEVLIAKAMSDMAIGPKLYGVFNGGNVQEYIDSYSITSTELKQESYVTEMARLYARIHTIEVPLKKVIVMDFEGFNVTQQSLEVVKPLIPPEEYAKLIKFNYEAEEEWINSFFKPDLLVRKFCQFDPNTANILVRRSPKPGQLKVVLVDYEISRYSYRTFDLSRFLIWSRLNAKDRNNMCIEEIEYSEETLSKFLHAYLDEYLKVTPADQVDPFKDNFNHLELELDIGMVMQAYEMVKIFVGKFQMFKDNPGFASFNPYFLQTYMDRKDMLIRKHPDIFPRK